ncbi:hypothetical protein GMMP1_100026 [Candidatus Magnetomoraceae bacterium gMMP-1]
MSERKNWVEIVLMPIVVAVVGVVGTLLITQQQNKTAALMRKTELEKTQEIAAADRQIKILELFADKILDPDQNQRLLALRLLTAVDGDLAKNLATAVSEDESEKPEIKALAKQVAKDVAMRGNSFPVIASYPTFDDAVIFAKKIENEKYDYMPEIYLSENNYYGVTLGGYLSQKEALKRVKYAKSKNIAADAYMRSSHKWGDNLFTK